jgi:hypothetical protein
MRFLGLSISFPHCSSVTRGSTSPRVAVHHQQQPLPPAVENLGVDNRLRRSALARHARRLLASFVLAATAVPATAQDLIVIEGEYGSPTSIRYLDTQKVTGSPVTGSALLGAIPDTHRVRGVTPIDGTMAWPTAAIVYTEQADGTSHLWKVDYVAGTAVVRVSPLHWDDNSDTDRPEDMVGIARTPLGMPVLGLLGPGAWHASIGQSGTLYGPLLDGSAFGLPGSTSAGATGVLPFPGPYLGGAARLQHLFVVTGGAPRRFHRVGIPSAQQQLLGLPNTPIELQSWTLPISGEVLGWTISSDGFFYAIVHHVDIVDGIASGFTELVRSKEDVDTAVGSMTLLSVGDHIQDWSSGEDTPVSLPKCCLTFAKK